MLAMWKVVYHQKHGVGYQFNAYDQEMPNFTIGEDERWIMFRTKPLQGRTLMMIVHNQFDFQDSQILYGSEKSFHRGERRYVNKQNN